MVIAAEERHTASQLDSILWDCLPPLAFVLYFSLILYLNNSDFLLIEFLLPVSPGPFLFLSRRKWFGF